MSAETVLPPEGPVGPDKQQHETSLLLANSQDTCQTDAKGLSDTTEKSTNPSPRDRCIDVQEDMSTESPAHGDPIRTQPQPSDGEATRLHNGLHPGMSNGHRTPPGATQPAAPSASFSEMRKPPPPVSQRVQKKLRSSLSVNSDSSRRSKGSSTGSHKPGSSPEGSEAEDEVFLHFSVPTQFTVLCQIYLVLCQAAPLFDVSLWVLPDVSYCFLCSAQTSFVFLKL
ncbi:myoD family inhibitor domain-containing protein isoform X2 [Tachysurus fulvidraco]|uniref:myoD family inhibitor domain-containing protein isoform X2 n=1 Tax=Tachysurus fulvidraco TaxID=1234273 RepID=UPI000F4F573B|nr:myoD family inhibitor domain-containing protein isoform X2 [Tachysurus fulvidraco]